MSVERSDHRSIETTTRKSFFLRLHLHVRRVVLDRDALPFAVQQEHRPHARGCRGGRRRAEDRRLDHFFVFSESSLLSECLEWESDFFAPVFFFSLSNFFLTTPAAP